jgi:N-acetylglucosaminyl-diphospho-decaprenol L-rhamnosyltransferase
MKKSGSNLFVPEAVVTHVGGESTARSADAMVTAHHRSAHLYVAKTHPGALWRPVVAVLGVGLRLRSRATILLDRLRG